MAIITSENKEIIELAEWGFLPDYIQDPKDAKAKKIRSGTLNAKSETILNFPLLKNMRKQIIA
ncbi:hypothetical protein N180_18060 [Pedobacter antarcticus 4BY]|uniref:Uncharacterized protein n=2 Tax=Pedobacter antarcticus TaxID=34086 RepID=A0A081PFW4_9SPHI|nr:hypothetical protein [Pedobacter antarcticus]KEQ29587.1 hypothetical protein N180_18060 [Pedobacter antarcticus 4BY]